MKYGTCKYGVTYKFDHPHLGEAIDKAIAMATTTKDTSADYDKIFQGMLEPKLQMKISNIDEHYKKWI